jgi:L-lactate dehydrogenase complex protein LldF
MTVKLSTPTFPDNAAVALGDARMLKGMANLEHGLVAFRANAAANLPEFEALRDAARDVKAHTLEHLDLYLEAYEKKVTESGGSVHWAADADEARDIILDICRKAGARTVTKSKSMLSEELDLNDHLAAAGITPVETDLGEYIIQLRNETPSHIIAPAIHVDKEQVEADFRRVHTHLAAARDLSDPTSLLAEARAVLRERFLSADVGITGANFLVAETGTSIIVTNEGNGDLTQILPRVHIVLASIEKVLPTLEDVATVMRVLARSATGQEMSVYTTLSTGPKRPGDPDGPDEYHVVLFDNGRSAMLGGPFHDMLRCIRCGACINHCPVYTSIGGHAYGWVYPGPMGSVLTPALIGIDKAAHLPNASTLCGRCESVCPMRIPLPKMLRHWREREFESHLVPKRARLGLKLFAFLARHPSLYGFSARLGALSLRLLGRRKGRIERLPFAGAGWTRWRDMPSPEGSTFRSEWAKRGRN